MLLYHHSDFELHDTKSHPESIARITRVNQMLDGSGWVQRCAKPTWNPASHEQCERNHSKTYLNELENWCQNDVGRVEVDTVVSKGSWRAATLAAGAVCDAVERVIAAEDSNAFCAIRPPGHHALPKSAMGFCLLNNIAIGAMHARSLGLNRVFNRRLGRAPRKRDSSDVLGRPIGRIRFDPSLTVLSWNRQYGRNRKRKGSRNEGKYSGGCSYPAG